MGLFHGDAGSRGSSASISRRSGWRAHASMQDRYTRSEQVTSQLYLESLPLWVRGLVSIPDHKRLTRELRLLERRTHRRGKDTVDHVVLGATISPTRLRACW
jgi:outer membrane biogenesis lipoprotein LolB